MLPTTNTQLPHQASSDDPRQRAMREAADLHGEVLVMKARTQWIQNRLAQLRQEIASLDHGE